MEILNAIIVVPPGERLLISKLSARVTRTFFRKVTDIRTGYATPQFFHGPAGLRGR